MAADPVAAEGVVVGPAASGLVGDGTAVAVPADPKETGVNVIGGITADGVGVGLGASGTGV